MTQPSPDHRCRATGRWAPRDALGQPAITNLRVQVSRLETFRPSGPATFSDKAAHFPPGQQTHGVLGKTRRRRAELSQTSPYFMATHCFVKCGGVRRGLRKRPVPPAGSPEEQPGSGEGLADSPRGLRSAGGEPAPSPGHVSPAQGCN